MRQAITRSNELSFFSTGLLKTFSEIWEIFLLKQIYFFFIQQYITELFNM